MTEIYDSVKKWREFRQQDFFKNKTIGFVPTMGNLHAGHQSLLTRSVKENDITVLSIFINPTQFNNPTDLKNYPRTFTADVTMAKNVGVDFILAPEFNTIYPDNYRYKVTENEFSKQLCGKHRPGHFDGVLTVVLKLLNLVKAQRAYFGEKDYQQLQLIKEMVAAFFIDTEIIACKTIRNEEGLALSSRNNLLKSEHRAIAAKFYELLKANNSLIKIAESLTNHGFIVDYIEEHNGRRYGAVHLGEVRLIDNIEI